MNGRINIGKLTGSCLDVKRSSKCSNAQQIIRPTNMLILLPLRMDLVSITSSVETLLTWRCEILILHLSTEINLLRLRIVLLPELTLDECIRWDYLTSLRLNALISTW